MTISKEAVEAAARMLPGNSREELLVHAEAALTAALPFLALRPAPSQSDGRSIEREAEILASTIQRLVELKRKKALLAFAAVVRAEAMLACAAAEREENEGLLAEAHEALGYVLGCDIGDTARHLANTAFTRIAATIARIEPAQ